MPKRFDLAPRAEWIYLGPGFHSLSEDLATVEDALTSGNLPDGIGALPVGLMGRAVQRADATWSLSRAQCDALHAVGASVDWRMDGSITPPVLPTPADGLTDGDTVNGEKPATTDISIPAASAPKAVDNPGTTSDSVTLTNVAGVTWVVDGVDYPSANMTGSTHTVPYTKGVSTTVAAKPSSGLYTITGTSAWQLTFSTGTASIVTSEDFNRADGAITAGTGTFTTNAALGGSGIASNVTGTGLSIASNTLKISSTGNELSIPYTNLTNVAVDVKIPTLPTGANGVIVSPARASGGVAYIEASVAPSGQVWFGKLETGGSFTTVNTGQMINAGGSIHIEKVGKAMKVTSAKADGTSGGAAYTFTFTADFTPVRGYIKSDSGLTLGYVDNLVLSAL